MFLSAFFPLFWDQLSAFWTRLDGNPVFDPLKSISDEPKSMRQNQNGVLFPNKKPKQLRLDCEQTGFATPKSPFAKMLKIVGFSSFVERTILYKMWYWAKL